MNNDYSIYVFVVQCICVFSIVCLGNILVHCGGA
jgi:hypothetical protein